MSPFRTGMCANPEPKCSYQPRSLRSDNKHPQIQVLRGFAALLVVLDHGINQVWGANNRFARYFSWHLGDVGVAIFFVISGFLMVISFGNSFGELGAPLRFARRRMQRIVPLYWLCTTIAIAMMIRHSGESAQQDAIIAIKSYLFIPFLNSKGLMQPAHSVGWTLNYEMGFYVIFAGCLAFKKRVGVAVCAFVLTAAVICGAAAQGASWGRDAKDIFSFWTYPIVMLFVAGMLLALYQRKLTPIRFSAAVFLPIVLFLAVTFALFVRTYPVSLAWRAVVWAGCALYVGLTILFEKADGQRSAVERFCERLGDVSYSTYLAHPFLLNLLFVNLRLADRIGFGASLVLFVVAAHVGGWLSYISVEKPLIAWFGDQRRFRTAVISQSLIPPAGGGGARRTRGRRPFGARDRQASAPLKEALLPTAIEGFSQKGVGEALRLREDD